MTAEDAYEAYAYASITFDGDIKPPWSALSSTDRDKWERVAHELTLADRDGRPRA